MSLWLQVLLWSGTDGGKGEYDYVNNPNEVYKFWDERVKEVSKQDILYTIGMRGVHDGQMNGAKNHRGTT